MLSISEDAIQELEAYFMGRDKSCLRIAAVPGGCSGPRLSLSVGEPVVSDEIFEVKGYSFCMDKDLLLKAGRISIDLNHTGFALRSEHAIGYDGCSSCPSSCKV